MYERIKNHKVFTFMVILSLIFGIGLTSKVLATQSNAYEKLKILSEVLYLIQTNYVEDVNSQDLIYGAINGMLKVLDPHSSFMPPDVYQEMQVETKGSFGGLGIQIGIKDNLLTVIAPIEDTPAYRAGIEAGDKIVKIEDKSTKDMTLMDAVKMLRGPKGTKVTISILREGFEKPKEFVMTRDIIEIKSVIWKVIDGNIGYVKLRQFQENTADELEIALDKLEEASIKAMILDLRNDPGGLLNAAVDVADKFLEKGKLIVYTKGRAKNQDMRFVARQGATHPYHPLIVLVNHGSASASEIVAGAIQDHGRGLLMGTKTFGKGSVQSVVPLSDNSGLRLTTAKYYTPSGRTIHEKGIVPDVIVELPKSGQESEEAALEALNKDKPAGKDKAAPSDKDKAAPQTQTPEKEAQPESKKEDSTDSTEQKTTEDSTKEKMEGKDDTAKKDPTLEKDIQLQRAVDMLKGILIFEKQKLIEAKKPN
jgi:carboxyl-terminal processing protease